MFKKFLNGKNFRYLLLYGVIGGLAAVLDFSVFTVCVKLFHIPSVISNLISMHIGMVCSFSLNTFFNFKKTDKLFRRFLSYYIIVLIGIGISSLIIYIGDFYFPVLYVKLFAMIVVTAFQFLFNRFVTYNF